MWLGRPLRNRRLQIGRNGGKGKEKETRSRFNSVSLSQLTSLSFIFSPLSLSLPLLVSGCLRATFHSLSPFRCASWRAMASLAEVVSTISSEGAVTSSSGAGGSSFFDRATSFAKLGLDRRLFKAIVRCGCVVFA